MTSISPISAAATQQSWGTQRDNPVLDSVSKLFGMNTDDLTAALKGGQTLQSIAASHGASQDQLVGTIATALQANRPGLSADEAQAIAQRLAAGQGRGHHHHHHASGATSSSAPAVTPAATTPPASTTTPGAAGIADFLA